MYQRKNSGFTLLEILLAMAIFALVAGLATSALQSVIKQYEQTQKAQVKWLEFERALTRITQDSLQIVDRQIRNEFGDLEDSLQISDSGASIKFTHGGWINYANQRRSTLQHVSYQLVSDKLVRGFWYNLDTIPQEKAVFTDYLSDIEYFGIRLQNKTGRLTNNLLEATHLVFDFKIKDLGEFTHKIPLPQPIVNAQS